VRIVPQIHTQLAGPANDKYFQSAHYLNLYKTQFFNENS